METSPSSERRRLRHRPNAAAVIAGVLLALATFNLLMALGGGLGLWNFGIFAFKGLRDAGLALGLWTIAAWVIAGTVSGFVAVTVARVFVAHDAYVCGSVTWAATCLTGLVLGWAWLVCAVTSGLASRDTVAAISGGIMSAFFVANLAAFASTLVGAAIAARRETKLLVTAYQAHPPSP